MASRNAPSGSTVSTAGRNTEPVISKSLLEFTSRVNNEPLLSLFLAKPNPEEFNDFVNLLKQRIQQEFNAFAGLRSAIDSNVNEEPPEFGAPDAQRTVQGKKITGEAVGEAIRMLREYVGTAQIGGFLAVLEALENDPENPARLNEMIKAFEALGPNQGAVLSYAPYIGSLLSDDPFENL